MTLINTNSNPAVSRVLIGCGLQQWWVRQGVWDISSTIAGGAAGFWFLRLCLQELIWLRPFRLITAVKIPLLTLLSLQQLLSLPQTMEESCKASETTPALPPLLERQVRARPSAVSALKSKLKRNASCSASRVQSTLTGFFPVVRWLPRYKLREYIWGDVMSGMIVGIILVPQAIAYCLLAGVDPIYGLYTSFYANIIYFLMGTSRHVSVGIFSLMSLMVGQVSAARIQSSAMGPRQDNPGVSLLAGGG